MESSQAIAAPPLASPDSRGHRIFAGPRAVLGFCRRKPLGGVGLFLVLLVLGTAIFADVLTTHEAARTNPVAKFHTPDSENWLGTDNLGRDIYARVVFGARVSAIVGPIAVFVAVLLAMLLGGLPGFIGGWVDLLAQRVLDMLMAFPPLIILISAVQLLPVPKDSVNLGFMHLDPSGQRGLYLIVVLGVVLSFGMARIVRSAVLSVKAAQYVEAARAVGASETRIFVAYVLPNIFPVLIVVATISLGSAILIEASTSFLGVGLPPDIPSWGRMLSEGRNFINQSVNVTIWPGLAIMLTVFGFNMLGDALRDELDPRMRGTR